MMEKKRRRRRYTLREQLLSLAIGIMIGLLAGLAHANSVQQHRQAIVSLPSEPPAITAAQEAPETPTAPPEPYNDPNIPDNVEEAARAAGAAYALEEALAGKQFDGWKLVEGRSNRKYADDVKVAETLVAAGYDEAMLYERKLYGITAMEKLVGKKKLTTTLGDLIIKPAGKPVLVPESDKREAINTTEAAKADFDNAEDAENVPQF